MNLKAYANEVVARFRETKKTKGISQNSVIEKRLFLPAFQAKQRFFAENDKREIKNVVACEKRCGTKLSDHYVKCIFAVAIKIKNLSRGTVESG